MAYTDKAYTIVNQEGVRVSQIYENGFDNTSFNKKTYYDLDTILDNFKDYDTSDGSFLENAPAGESIANPLTPSKRVQIGNDNYKGIFLEKPAFDLRDKSTAYFFPLGSSGLISDCAAGFNFHNFLSGDFSEDPSQLSTDSTVICHETFNETSDYDNDVFYNFEGAHVLASEAINSNILKFPKVATISKEVTVKKGNTLSVQANEYLVDTWSDYGLLDVTIDSLDKENYTVDDAGNIQGKNLVEKDTTYTLNLSLHKYFIFKDSGSRGKNWIGLYYSSGPYTTNDNFLKSQDLAIIGHNNSSSISDIYQQQFLADVTIQENKGGNYYFSFYIRSDSPAYVYGLSFVPENTTFGLSSYINSLANTECCGDSTLLTSKGYTFKNSNVELSVTGINGFKIDSTWKRVAGKTYLTPGSYKAVLWVSGKESTSSTPSEFRVCGMKVEKDMLSPYDYRSVNYLNYDSSSLNKKKHILYFDFNKISVGLAKDKKWAISYLRKFEGLASDNQSHYDSVGSSYFGYQGNSVLINGEIQTIEGVENIDDFYNGWERIIITHEMGESSVSVEDISLGHYSNRKIRSYTLKVNIENFDSALPEMGNSNNCNLLLGGRVEGNQIITCNGIYRDVWFFPEGLTEDEMKSFKSQYMVITNKTRTRDSGEVENIVTMRSGFLQEEKPN